jgi:uncharacterized damage-inducible protein DinB
MLQKAINNVFLQLTTSLQQLTAGQYVKECNSLSGASIGKHVRHIIELFQSLQNGYENGIINYDKRKRDTRIENEKQWALTLLHEIRVDLNRSDKELSLESSYDDDSTEVIYIKTNYNREIVYNLEHAIHHMALIRIGINEVSSIELPQNFGVASSTVRYKQQCAQ